ncbi:MAG: chemotaxis protein CheX [Candidatus Omnitrophica bacterium]|nr:chemotaxis protein CheX [Candidatus Omnitrophota bacterium]
MPKEFDKQVLNTTIIGVVSDTFEQMCRVKYGAEPVVTEKEIIESDSRMRVFPMEKFNGPAYATAINYYLSQKDKDDGHVVGTLILFIKEDQAEKLLRAFNRSIKDSENEEVMLDICGEMCNIIAGKVKNGLTSRGYADLFLSAPIKKKNTVPEGLPFDYSLYTKQEIVFTFWGQKCIVVEACLGSIPQTAK